MLRILSARSSNCLRLFHLTDWVQLSRPRAPPTAVRAREGRADALLAMVALTARQGNSIPRAVSSDATPS